MGWKDGRVIGAAPGGAPAVAPAAAPAATPATPAPAAAPDNSAGSYLHWLATRGLGQDYQRSFERAATLGAGDWLTGGVMGAGKALATGGDVGQGALAEIARQRADTEAARQNIGWGGRLATDIAGSAPIAAIPGGALVQGPVAGATQGYFTGHGGPAGGGGASDVGLGALWGLGGGLAAKGVGAVADPVARFARGRFGADPAGVVYPHAPGTDTSASTLGGVPGVYPGSAVGSLNAQQVAAMARDMESAAQGETGGITSPGMQAIVKRINNLAVQGTPTGGTPGSGLPAVQRSYWQQGGPPGAAGGGEGGWRDEVAAMIGGGAGGALGHLTGIPTAREIGVLAGSRGAPWLLNRFTAPTAETAYPALAGGPPGFPDQARQALASLLIGGSQDAPSFNWPQLQ